MFKRLWAVMMAGFILLSALTATAGDVSSDSSEAVTTHDMEANVAALLEVLVDSLYTQKQIFLRELISNCVDAIDKLRFLALQDQSLLPDIDDTPLSVRISLDPDGTKLHVADNGVGMTEEEMIKFLGSIAESGTRRFAELKTGENETTTTDGKKKVVKNSDTDLIGQFGVGFYSAFLVAKNVDVVSVSYTEPGHAHFWRSNGTSSFSTGSYELSAPEEADNTDSEAYYDSFIRKHGTHIILHLNPDRATEANVTDTESVKKLATKYSAYLSYPIFIYSEVNETKTESTETKTEEETESKPEEVETPDMDVDNATEAKADVDEEAKKAAKESEVDSDVESDDEDEDETETEAEKTEESKVEVEDESEEKKKEEKEEDKPKVFAWQRVSDVEPIWRQDPSNVTADQYRSFYEGSVRNPFYGQNSPLGTARHWSHFKVEGDQGEFRALLYVPDTAPYDFINNVRANNVTPGVALYARRVYVASADKEGNQLLPRCLGFVRGIADADQIEIHVSRELLQDNRELLAMRRTLLRKSLAMLQEIADHDFVQRYDMPTEDEKEGVIDESKSDPKFAHIAPNSYQEFFDGFGIGLKTCLPELRNFRKATKAVIDLLRFPSTWQSDRNYYREKKLTEAKREVERQRREYVDASGEDKELAQSQAEVLYPLPDENDTEYLKVPMVSLKSYVERMPSWQKDIYVIFGLNMDDVENSPALEAPLSRGLEVILCAEPYDEVMIRDYIRTYDGHKIVSVLDEETVYPDPPKDEDDEKENEDDIYKELGPSVVLAPLVALMQRVLPDMGIKRVEISPRLVDSPSVIVSGRGSALSATRERLMHINGGDPRLRNLYRAEKVLEINPDHSIIRTLNRRAVNLMRKQNVTSGADIHDTALELAIGILADAAAVRSGVDLDGIKPFAKRLQLAADLIGDLNETSEESYQTFIQRKREALARKKERGDDEDDGRRKPKYRIKPEDVITSKDPEPKKHHRRHHDEL